MIYDVCMSGEVEEDHHRPAIQFTYWSDASRHRSKSGPNNTGFGGDRAISSLIECAGTSGKVHLACFLQLSWSCGWLMVLPGFSLPCRRRTVPSRPSALTRASLVSVLSEVLTACRVLSYRFEILKLVSFHRQHVWF